MGYGVSAYAVDDSVWEIVGSRSEELVSLLEWGADDLIEFLDDALATRRTDGRPMPDARATLRQLVMGEPLDARAGVAYAYWFVRMCESGQFLPNDAWVPIRMDFFHEVEHALERLGVVNVSVRNMVFGGLPIPLPPPEDFPGMGYTARKDMRALLERLSPVDLDAEPNRYLREAIAPLTGWLRTCADGELDLVCFYH